MKLLTNILIILVAATFLTSCASSGGGRSRAAYVQVMSSGRILIDNKPVSIDRIGPTLKKRGFDSRSPVNINVPTDISPRILKAITISLTNNGFHRVLFVKPKQSVADVLPPANKRR